MNATTEIQITPGLIADKTLRDELGNTCRSQLYSIGADKFELYLTRWNGSIPTRYIGDLAMMIDVGQHFVDARIADGFAS